MPSGGMLAEIVIEGKDAINFGARDVQRLGYDRQRFTGYIAELFLHTVQDRQKRSFEVAILADDRGRARNVGHMFGNSGLHLSQRPP
jgi:hypothetical protein